MSQLKRYNGSSWEVVGGNVLPKTTTTSSNTDTYSCNYINSLNEYSTSEIRIGTWVDGKPLYRITLSIPSQTVPNDHWIELNHNLGVKYYIEAKGMVLTPGWAGNMWQPIPRVVTDAISQWGIGYGDLVSNQFRIQMGTSYSSVVDGFITFIYTKTSDYS